ncbi:barstar family protein [Kitasatospora sp. NBC_01266]|uniref:barstar family protein n=1 Tax=Kitasatospora sp. NBC_01266 TaxID=2903572 RepID=UPI002E376CCE|nr:barstar family protein [Kitasatospora sp. NBC_01266]
MDFHLDGATATDRAGLYSALGTALNGPDGYYGSNLDALADCLRGGFGPVPPFTLVWHDWAAAEHSPMLPPGYAWAVVELLGETGVTVRLR